VSKITTEISQYLTCYDNKAVMQFLTQSAGDDTYMKQCRLNTSVQ